MTKQDFELIAEAIRTFKLTGVARHDLAVHFANYLYMTNDRFDTPRFMRACEADRDE